MDGTPVKKKGNKPVSKASRKTSVMSMVRGKSLVQRNPKLAVLVLIVIYFLLDYMMMNAADGLHPALTVIFTMLAPSMLYSYYVFDYQRDIFPQGGSDVPKFVKNKKKFVTFGWLAVTVWGVIFLVAEPYAMPKLFPVLDSNYYRPQILLMLFIAPVMEEVIFRYLLYDRWLKRKWGWFWGFAAASLVFVVCHPVTNTHALVIYWVPTLLFFLVYEEFGLYGAILIHMLYNMMAI